MIDAQEPTRFDWRSYPFETMFYQLDARLRTAGLTASETVVKGTLHVMQYLLTQSHDKSGIHARPCVPGPGVLVSLPTGDLTVKLLPSRGNDDLDREAEWEIYVRGELREKWIVW